MLGPSDDWYRALFWDPIEIQETIYSIVCGSVGPFPPYISNFGQAKSSLRIFRFMGDRFSIFLSKFQKVFMFVIFGTSGDVHDPQNPLFLILDPPDHST